MTRMILVRTSRFGYFFWLLVSASLSAFPAISAPESFVDTPKSFVDRSKSSVDRSKSFFDMNERRSENITPFYKWTGMVGRFEKQKKVPDNDCDKVRFHPCAILEWRALLDSLREKSLHEQLDIINSWANTHPYIVDQINWGVEDFWETPYEFLEVSGNCKDYAIAKYYSLKALGVPIDRMRVIILEDLNLGGVIHAVLGVYVGHELLILDNQNPQVTPSLKIYHYRPIYGINEDAWWAYYPKQVSVQ